MTTILQHAMCGVLALRDAIRRNTVSRSGAVTSRSGRAPRHKKMLTSRRCKALSPYFDFHRGRFSATTREQSPGTCARRSERWQPSLFYAVRPDRCWRQVVCGLRRAWGAVFQANIRVHAQRDALLLAGNAVFESPPTCAERGREKSVGGEVVGRAGLEPATKGLCVPPRLSPPVSGSWSGLCLAFRPSRRVSTRSASRVSSHSTLSAETSRSFARHRHGTGGAAAFTEFEKFYARTE